MEKDRCLDEITKPSVDNTELACSEYIDAGCVLIKSNSPTLNISSGDSLEKVLTTLMMTVKKQQQEITNLQNYIQNL